MICAKCKADIDNDSFYCDQCGVEIMICPKCSIPKMGKVCTADGTKLVSAKDFVSGSTVPAPAQNPDFVQVPEAPAQSTNISESAPAGPLPQPAAAAQYFQPTQLNGPVLCLVNNAINLNIKPAPGDIIGRKQGAFAGMFASYNQISGKHVQFNFDQRFGWTVTDLDSSNGTQYNGIRLQPMQPQPMQSNARIILANIEFIVQISGGDDGDKTVRV